jgi:hypothetical protein
MTRAAVLEPECVPVASHRSPLTGQPPAADPDVTARVHELLLLMYPPGPPLERRIDRRFPYPQLIRLTPIGEDGQEIAGEALVVAGKTLSERGVGFYHPQPLPHRKVIASFHAGDDRWLSILVDLSWCRFTGQGWYESGGRFLEAVPKRRTERDARLERNAKPA